MQHEWAKYAVCCLLMNNEGKVVAISRGEDTTKWGLPGGRVEHNESLDVAVVREMYEETGYVIAAPQSVYTAFVPGKSNCLCTTFVGHVVAQAPDSPRSSPFEGYVRWVHPQLLVEGPYGNYNRALFEHLNIEYQQ